MTPLRGCAGNWPRTTGNRPRTTGSRRRGGFTLVELLVVIFIMLAITAITLPVIAPAVQNRDVREGARMLDVFINGARTRAKATNKTYGVMLERMPGLPNGCVTLSYCEQPDPYTGDYASAVSYPGMGGGGGSTIRLLGNGGFGGWAAPVMGVPTVDPIVFPMSDAGWISGPAPKGGYITNIAPGDVLTVQGTPYRIWAGEPFLDLDQNGYCNKLDGTMPGTPIGVIEPFVDVDGSGSWTPPNPPPGLTCLGFNGAPVNNTPLQPYVDPDSGYFVQPAGITPAGPFPTLAWNSTSAFVTYTRFDPVQAASDIGAAYQQMISAPGTPYYYNPANPVKSDDWNPNTTNGWSFSFLRRPIKTSAPSIQLPGDAVIDLGANFFYDTQPIPNVIGVPASGIEVLLANANGAGWFSGFRPNPALDPSVKGTPASLAPGTAGYMPPDTTSVMITFQPSGTVDRVFSWSEANSANSAMNAVNWSDWQGRIPAGPIYLLVGRQELLNGDPTLVTQLAQMADAGTPPPKPIYNVQDPTSLWVVIDPRSGAVATTENVGYNLDSTILNGGGTPVQQMGNYWAANVYYARRLGRDMLDIGGR